MLPTAVLWVFVLASSPLASSHIRGHGYDRPYHHRHHSSWKPWGLWKKHFDACCIEECPEGYHCRIEEFTKDAKCFPNDPCEELLCRADLPCVIPPDAPPCCGSLCCAVSCPADQHCRIDELSASPKCFLDDPCQAKGCTSDQPCVVPYDGTPAYCYSPPPNPCLNTECCEGSKCFVIDGGAACLSGCQLNGQYYQHGQVLNVTASPRCQSLKCSDGIIKTVFNVRKGVPCKNEFATFSETPDGCYFFPYNISTYVKLSWCAARDVCQIIGGDLATIDYTSIWAFLQSQAPDISSGPFPAWVGAIDSKWLAGREIQQENWGLGEPDQLKSCVSINVDGKLLAEDCNTLRAYVCQRF